MSKFERTKYIPTIDTLLKIADLNSISAKKIRSSLQDLLKEDLTEHKKEIDDIIVERYLLVQKGLENERKTQSSTHKKEPESLNDESTVQENHTKTQESDVSDEDTIEDPYVVKSDAEYAAELHAQLNERRSRAGRKARATRKIKSSTNRASREKREMSEKQKNNPFQAPLLLSPNLRSLLGEPELSRPQTVKALWKYIKENNLQNPQNKREILCDERMKPVFGTKTDIFKMNSILSKNLFKKDEIVL